MYFSILVRIWIRIKITRIGNTGYSNKQNIDEATQMNEMKPIRNTGYSY